MAGASLAGDVDDFQGVIEAKAPKSSTHLDYLRSRKVPGRYTSQCLHAMWITGAAWCDFLSWCPDFPAELRICLVRVEPDEAAIREYEVKARAFLDEVEAKAVAVRTMATKAREASF